MNYKEQLDKDLKEFQREFIISSMQTFPENIILDDLSEEIYNQLTDLVIDYSHLFSKKYLSQRQLNHINQLIDLKLQILKELCNDELYVNIVLKFIILINDSKVAAIKKELFETVINIQNFEKIINKKEIETI